ncbi:MAG: hypothetical protein HOP02_10045 [Methylococcaceae bacterium]|nr:hypothetical protein [Methylococcaceae bacterium]
MKNKQNNLNPLTTSRSLVVGICAALLVPALANANSANGHFILKFDQTTLMKMNGGSTEIGQRWWWVEDFLDQSFNNVAIDGGEPNPTPGLEALPNAIVEMDFAVNAPDIPAAPAEASRQLQPTSFNYTDDPTKGTGKIGLSGAFRMRSDSRKGYLLPKDLSLAFYPERVGKGGSSIYEEINPEAHGESGWAIMTNEYYFNTRGLFDLVNVTTSTVNGALSLTGDLIWAAEWGSFMLLDRDVKVGTVTLIPTGDQPPPGSVPVVTPIAPSSGFYDDATQEADIVDVQVQNTHYFVQLKLQANGLFGLKSATSISASADTLPAQYDESTQNLVIPKIKAMGKNYTVVLKNTGNYQFSLVDIREVP